MSPSDRRFAPSEDRLRDSRIRASRPPSRHCKERSDEAIQIHAAALDCLSARKAGAVLPVQVRPR
jgi:hypothetical protein